MSVWIEPAEWARVQQLVPIVCIDVLPLRMLSGLIDAVGLIDRNAPHQGRRWMLVGGRLLRNESFAEGAARQLRLTLGEGIRFEIDDDAQPIYAAQYFTDTRPIGGVDPRQHAVALVLPVPIEGEPRAADEALAFQWFPPDDLPPAHAFGFDQDRVLAACLARLGATVRGA